jgi:predicted small integral membrane protein
MTSRKTTNSIPLVIAIALIATMVVAGGMTIITTKYVFAQGGEKKFTAKLSGKN